MALPYFLFFIILLPYGYDADLTYAQTRSQIQLENKNILILNAFESNIPAFERTNQGLSAALQSGGIGIRNQFYEHLDLVRNPDSENRKLMTQLISKRYSERNIDLIITLFPESLNFLLEMGPDFFSAAPVLALLLPQGFKLPETDRQIISQPVTPDLKRTLEIGLKLVPKAERIYVVSGTHPLDRWLEKMVRKDSEKWKGRLDFRYMSGLPPAKILSTISAAPAESIVFITAYSQDVTGKYQTTVELSRQIAQVSEAPVFGLLCTTIGNAIAGGSLISFKYIGTKAGELALDILRGVKNIEDISDVLEVPQVDTYDWLQLKHWHLNESALPKGSVIINREFSIWDLKYYFFGVLIFILAQSLLIVRLLVQRRHRRLAEESLRQKTRELDQFFNISLDLLCIANTDGYFLRLNPAWERTLGHSKEELMAKKFLDFVHADDLARTHDAISALASQQRVIHFENRYQCKDGTYRWLDWTSAPSGNLIFAVARDVTDLKLAENNLQERLQFEQLMSDFSAKFVNIPPDRVDAEIEYGLKLILKFFQVDRAALVRTLPDRSAYQITHVAYGEDVPPVPAGAEIPISINPWAYEKLILKHETVAYSRIDDLPPEASVDKQTWTEWGIQSNVNIPILVGEPVDHIIAINSVKRERVWPEELFSRLQILGEIFVNAMELKKIRLDINERLRFEHLISDLSAGFVNLPPEKVDSEINSGLRSITEFLNVDRCSIGLFSEDKTQLALVFEYVLPGGEPAPQFISKEQMPWYLEQLLQGNPVVFNQVEDLPPEAEKERQVCLHKSMKSVLSVPIVSSGETLGSCALVATRSALVWPKELVKRFRLITDIFSNALERKQAEEIFRESERILRQNENDLRSLAGRLIHNQEEERSRLARELHDDLAQRLAVFAIDVGQLEQQLGDLPEPVREALHEMKKDIVTVSQDVHNLSRQIHPSILDDLGLIKAVESECNNFSNREGTEIAFNHVNIPTFIPKGISLSLYRIIQEGLTNIAKHACADHISVSLKGTGHDVLLSVQDDGIGFDSAEVGEKPGLGFSSMRERTRLMHGEFSISSQPERGTVITVRVPLTRREG
jgi:PAS domain S-box-containing protein